MSQKDLEVRLQGMADELQRQRERQSEKIVHEGEKERPSEILLCDARARRSSYTDTLDYLELDLGIKPGQQVRPNRRQLLPVWGPIQMLWDKIKKRPIYFTNDWTSGIIKPQHVGINWLYQAASYVVAYGEAVAPNMDKIQETADQVMKLF